MGPPDQVAAPVLTSVQPEIRNSSSPDRDRPPSAVTVPGPLSRPPVLVNGPLTLTSSMPARPPPTARVRLGRTTALPVLKLIVPESMLTAPVLTRTAAAVK